MVRSLVNLISENLRESENDRYKKRKELLKRSVKSNRFLPFRKLYAQDKDPLISDTLFYFFSSVRNCFKHQEESFWDFEKGSTTQTNIFQTTVGYDTLLKILVDILKKESINLEDLDVKTFNSYLDKAKRLKIGDINRYSFNNRGKKILYLDMSLALWPSGSGEDSRVEELNRLLQH